MSTTCNANSFGLLLLCIFSGIQLIMMTINTAAKNSITHGKGARTATWWTTVLFTILCMVNIGLGMGSSEKLVLGASLVGLISVILYYASDQWDKRDHKQCDNDWFVVRSPAWSKVLLSFSFACLICVVPIAGVHVYREGTKQTTTNIRDCTGSMLGTVHDSFNNGLQAVVKGVPKQFNKLTNTLTNLHYSNKSAK